MKQESGNLRYRFNVDNGTDKLSFEQKFSTTSGAWSTPNNSITLDVWAHVAIVYNSSATTNDPVIYIGGASQSITEDTTPVGSATSDVDIDIRLGNSSGLNRTFDGSICEVVIWDGALSAAEILALAHTINPLRIRRPDMKMYLPIPGHTSPEADMSGNKNNGTVTGAVKSAHAPVGPYNVPFSPRTVA